MADKKISQLPSGNLESGTLFPIVTSGVTSQTTFADIQNAIGGSGGSQDWQSTLNINPVAIDSEPSIVDSVDSNNYLGFSYQGFGIYRTEGTTLGFGGNTDDLIITGSDITNTHQNILHWTDKIAGGTVHYRFKTDRLTGDYTIATLDDISTGGTQGLQSVLDNGNEATDKILQMWASPTGSTELRLNSPTSYVAINPGIINVGTQDGKSITINNDKIQVINGGNSQFNFPSKIDGNLHTLATLEDIGSLVSTTAPSSATDTGTVGEIRVAAGFIYWCTAPNTWIRASGATW